MPFTSPGMNRIYERKKQRESLPKPNSWALDTLAPNLSQTAYRAGTGLSKTVLDYAADLMPDLSSWVPGVAITRFTPNRVVSKGAKAAEHIIEALDKEKNVAGRLKYNFNKVGDPVFQDIQLDPQYRKTSGAAAHTLMGAFKEDLGSLLDRLQLGTPIRQDAIPFWQSVNKRLARTGEAPNLQSRLAEHIDKISRDRFAAPVANTAITAQQSQGLNISDAILPLLKYGLPAIGAGAAGLFGWDLYNKMRE